MPPRPAENAAPSVVHLYEGTSASELNVQELASFLGELLPGAVVDVRHDFIGHWIERYDDDHRLELATRLARARIRRPDRQEPDPIVLPGEIDFERRFLTAGARKPVGMIYDGRQMLLACLELLAPEETGTGHCHIALTNQLFATWDADDLRFHARASLYGLPSLVSTTGLVEAPAKPREFYLGRQLGAPAAEMEAALDDQFLRRGDPRLQEAAKGYLLQALFYHVTGDAFCENRDCRLFNAHWQQDLIHAQLRPDAGLCEHHRNVLESWA